jgi:peptidoglycan/LPS O-acetylase OafA/YrhL
LSSTVNVQTNDVSQQHRNNNAVAALNLLRGVAALMVCLFHCKKYIWPKTNPYSFLEVLEYGYLGVYVFFVVSGFVIPYSMYTNRYSIQKIGRYLLKRTVRIEPPYIIFIALLFLWNLFVYSWKGWGMPVLFSFTKFLFNITYLAPLFKVKWILIIFWTLGVEFQFYLLSGITYDTFMRSRWLRYGLMAAMMVAGKFIPADYYTVFNYYVFFAIGFQTFLRYVGRINWREYSLTVLSLLFFTYFYEINAAVPFVIATIAGILFVTWTSRVTDFFGKISYSLYLTHGLSGGAVSVFMIGVLPSTTRFIAAIIVSIAFAAVYFRIVERYFLRWSKKIRY